MLHLTETIDAKISAEHAGLRYTNLDTPGITRRKVGKGFSFRSPDGQRVTSPEGIQRIRSLAIPPAWTDVWISPDPRGHIQAIGKDERGRRQYRYHSKFREVRESAKFEHLIAFAESLPSLRARVKSDMAKPGLGHSKVLATVVHLLETTMIRVGNAAYARDNKSYGLTTLLNRHVSIDGAELRFNFTGKSGKTWCLNFRDRRVARIVKNCQEIPGQHLFQYVDDAGEHQPITSADVNTYLKEVSGSDVTAKDFRTWTGTLLAAMTLAEFEKADGAAAAKKNVTTAIKHVAARLGNTPTICRKCYVHPDIVAAYLDGELLIEIQKDIDQQLSGNLEHLRPEEGAVLAFLRTRIARDLRRKAA